MSKKKVEKKRQSRLVYFLGQLHDSYWARAKSEDKLEPYRDRVMGLENDVVNDLVEFEDGQMDEKALRQSALRYMSAYNRYASVRSKLRRPDDTDVDAARTALFAELSNSDEVAEFHIVSRKSATDGDPKTLRFTPWTWRPLWFYAFCVGGLSRRIEAEGQDAVGYFAFDEKVTAKLAQDLTRHLDDGKSVSIASKAMCEVFNEGKMKAKYLALDSHGKDVGQNPYSFTEKDVRDFRDFLVESEGFFIE